MSLSNINKAFPSELINFSLLIISDAVASSSTCSSMYHCKNDAAALSRTSSATSASSFNDLVTNCSCSKVA